MISITDGLQAIYNSNMREKTPLELEREVRQLTNNWNELEEWLKDMKTPKQDNFGDYGYTWALKIDVILDKMKEIKGGNNVSSRD